MRRFRALIVVTATVAASLALAPGPATAGVDTVDGTIHLTPGGWSGIATVAVGIFDQGVGNPFRYERTFRSAYSLDPEAPSTPHWQSATYTASASIYYNYDGECAETAALHGSGPAMFGVGGGSSFSEYFLRAFTAESLEGPIQACDGSTNGTGAVVWEFSLPDRNWTMSPPTDYPPLPADPTVLSGAASGIVEEEALSGPPGVPPNVPVVRRWTIDQRWQFTVRPDQDGDGRPDDEDCQPGIPNLPGDECLPVSDRDLDGIDDELDQCDGTPPSTPVDAFGCPIGQGGDDTDDDGVDDASDECPEQPGSAPSGCPRIRGRAPSYLDEAELVEPPNADAIRRRIWAPGLADGFVPQGVTIVPSGVFDGERILVSGYLTSAKRCRIYAVDPTSGQPEPVVFEFLSGVRCTHAGGIDYYGRTANGVHLAYVADTYQLIRLDLGRAFSPDASVRGTAVRKRWPLNPNTSNQPSTDRKPFNGSFVNIEMGADCPYPAGCLWVGTFSKTGNSWLRRFNVGYLDNKPSMQLLTVRQSTQRVAVPRKAQGADVDTAGVLWSSSSRAGSPGCLHQNASFSSRSSYPFVPGSEELRFAGDGSLWTVSETGSGDYRGAAFEEYPLLLNLDPGALIGPGGCDPD